VLFGDTALARQIMEDKDERLWDQKVDAFLIPRSVHLDEPSMNDVKLRHVDEPQMNSSVNESCHLGPIEWAFSVLYVFSTSM
jgi:hypothetical protein